MSEPLNVMSIVCLVTLDIVDESNKTDAHRIVLKNHINHLFNIAFQYIGQTNRIILVTDNGAEIAYLGPPQDAILMAKDILNGILTSNKTGSTPLSVRIGIHLKPVKKLKDLNKQSNIIGNGISAAGLLVSKAKPNEIRVSRSYSKNTPASNQTQSELSNQKFDKLDNHVLDYQAHLTKFSLEQTTDNQAIVLDLPVKSTISIQPAEAAKVLKSNNWKYAFASLLIIILLFSTVELVNKPSNTPIKKAKTLPIRKSQSSSPANASTNSKPSSQQANADDKASLDTQNQLEHTEAVRPLPENKKVKQGTSNSIDDTSKKAKPNEKLSWETLKESLMQGQKNDCTQSEIAMNQCR